MSSADEQLDEQEVKRKAAIHAENMRYFNKGVAHGLQLAQELAAGSAQEMAETKENDALSMLMRKIGATTLGVLLSALHRLEEHMTKTPYDIIPLPVAVKRRGRG